MIRTAMLAARLEAIGHELLAASARVAAKATPIVDQAAGAAIVLGSPQLAVEAGLVRLVVDKLNAELQLTADEAADQLRDAAIAAADERLIQI